MCASPRERGRENHVCRNTLPIKPHSIPRPVTDNTGTWRDDITCPTACDLLGAGPRTQDRFQNQRSCCHIQRRPQVPDAGGKNPLTSAGPPGYWPLMPTEGVCCLLATLPARQPLPQQMPGPGSLASSQGTSQPPPMQDRRVCPLRRHDYVYEQVASFSQVASPDHFTALSDRADR